MYRGDEVPRVASNRWQHGVVSNHLYLVYLQKHLFMVKAVRNYLRPIQNEKLQTENMALLPVFCTRPGINLTIPCDNKYLVSSIYPCAEAK